VLLNALSQITWLNLRDMDHAALTSGLGSSDGIEVSPIPPKTFFHVLSINLGLVNKGSWTNGVVEARDLG
jgi:hypothetical protein